MDIVLARAFTREVWLGRRAGVVGWHTCDAGQSVASFTTSRRPAAEDGNAEWRARTGYLGERAALRHGTSPQPGKKRWGWPLSLFNARRGRLERRMRRRRARGLCSQGRDIQHAVDPGTGRESGRHGAGTSAPSLGQAVRSGQLSEVREAIGGRLRDVLSKRGRVAAGRGSTPWVYRQSRDAFLGLDFAGTTLQCGVSGAPQNHQGHYWLTVLRRADQRTPYRETANHCLTVKRQPSWKTTGRKESEWHQQRSDHSAMCLWANRFESEERPTAAGSRATYDRRVFGWTLLIIFYPALMGVIDNVLWFPVASTRLPGLGYRTRSLWRKLKRGLVSVESDFRRGGQRRCGTKGWTNVDVKERRRGADKSRPIKQESISDTGWPERRSVARGAFLWSSKREYDVAKVCCKGRLRSRWRKVPGFLYRYLQTLKSLARLGSGLGEFW